MWFDRERDGLRQVFLSGTLRMNERLSGFQTVYVERNGQAHSCAVTTPGQGTDNDDNVHNQVGCVRLHGI